MDSEPGDYIGGGDNYYYTPAEGGFSASQNYDNGVSNGIYDNRLPPAGDREAAILATLPAPGYTAIFRGRAGASEVALVEVYRLSWMRKRQFVDG